MATNLDIVRAEDRSAFVTQLLKDEFGLETEEVTGIGEHNTFVLAATIKAPLTPLPPRRVQPGTVALPSPLPKKLIIRIANPLTMNDPARKIENEVAAMALLRASASRDHAPIADVYAWSTQGWAWIVMEFMEGIPLIKVFNDLTAYQKRDISSATAVFIKALQSVRLPASSTLFGGFSFDESGHVVMAGHPLGYGGPYADATAYIRGMLQAQLTLADKNPAIQGWHAEGMRVRLDRFMADPNGFDKVAQGLPQDAMLCHFDLDIMNILVDPATFRVTAFIDFEWAHAGPPSDEFVNGLANFGHLHAGPYDEEAECVHGAALTASGGIGDEYPQSGVGSGNGWDWENMRIFDAALAEHDVIRPRTIPGMDDAARVYWFAQEICQWYFGLERWLKRVNVEEETAKAREKLDKFLKDWGF